MRLFIGIRVPQEIRDHLSDLWKTLSDRPHGLRNEPIANWHMTMAFLGEVDKQNLEILSALIARATERPPRGSFSVEGFETFPRKKPSFVIANINREHAVPWKPFVEKMRDMVSVAAPHVDRKPWIPHVTVARSHSPLPTWEHPIKHIAWKPTELSLIMSDAGQHGSKYTDLNIFPLC
ncbi:MAG: RNA 2',3'-cyclic phosphodiesterase [Patescibacteria group bacterium]